jgi:hypothetical protein
MNENTLQKMRSLKFFGMLRAFRTTLEAGQMNRYTPDEMIAFLIESEWDDRHNRKLNEDYEMPSSVTTLILKISSIALSVISKKMIFIV